MNRMHKRVEKRRGRGGADAEAGHCPLLGRGRGGRWSRGKLLNFNAGQNLVTIADNKDDFNYR